MTTPEQPRDLPDDHVGGGVVPSPVTRLSKGYANQAADGLHMVDLIDSISGRTIAKCIYEPYADEIIAATRTPVSPPSTYHVGGGEHREREVQCHAYPDRIGDLYLGESRADGERMCHEGHDVQAGHPLYWPQPISQYDDSDPRCLEHAIEQYADQSSGYSSPPSADAAMVEEWTGQGGKAHHLMVRLACAGEFEYDGDEPDGPHTGIELESDIVSQINDALAVLRDFPHDLPTFAALDLASRQHAGVEKGMVLVPREATFDVLDAMTEVEITNGRGGTTEMSWEEAQSVWDAILATLAPLPAAPATETGEMA